MYCFTVKCRFSFRGDWGGGGRGGGDFSAHVCVSDFSLVDIRISDNEQRTSGLFFISRLIQ